MAKAPIREIKPVRVIEGIEFENAQRAYASDPKNMSPSEIAIWLRAISGVIQNCLNLETATGEFVDGGEIKPLDCTLEAEFLKTLLAAKSLQAEYVIIRDPGIDARKSPHGSYHMGVKVKLGGRDYVMDLQYETVTPIADAGLVEPSVANAILKNLFKGTECKMTGMDTEQYADKKAQVVQNWIYSGCGKLLDLHPMLQDNSAAVRNDIARQANPKSYAAA